MSQSDAKLSGEYLAAIVASSDDAILSKDLNGVVRSFNAAAERLFGYTAEEMIGRPITVLIPADRQAEETEILARLRRGERIDHFETVRISRDGRLLDISLSVSPIRDESGTIVGAAKIARDITEQKRAAAALAAQREWYRVTLASIGDAVIASDPEGRVTFMNDVAKRLTAWNPADAVGKPLGEVFRIINEETRAPVENPAEKVLHSGVTVVLASHTVLIGRDGREWPIADSAAPILDDAGRILGVVLVFHDVTEQQRAHAALAAQRGRFETTLASIGDGVIATDVAGHIEFMNAVAEQLTGWRLEEVRGRPCNDVFRIIDESTRQPAPNPVSQVLTQGDVVGLSNDTLLIAADGTERAIDDSGAPIREAGGRLAGVVLVFRDVSERRRIEAERQAAARERERLLTAERQARLESEQANRVKDDFVAMLSHELRTPLSAILGWTQILQAKSPGEETLHHGLEVIERNTRAQSQLISDLLDISRIGSGKLVLDVQTVDLGEVLADSLETVRYSADDKGVALRSRTEPVNPIVGDAARLGQVMWNLLTNAIKFTPRGGRVDVQLRQAGSTAELTVRDTGVGIRAEDLPRVFERFRQGGGATTGRHGGLGLGLSITKHLVELHGGSVRAASEGEGKGVVFTVELPLLAHPADHTTGLPEKAAVHTEGISLEGLTVLVVEDEPDMRALIQRVLEDHGARVLAAASAPEGIRMLAAGPDLLLSDIRLPEMDGYELIRRIRARGDARARMPAVALTAFAGSEDRTRAIRSGFQSHLAKPFERSELVFTVASFAKLIFAQRRG
jgi:PAS domain S-box-containing protein